MRKDSEAVKVKTKRVFEREIKLSQIIQYFRHKRWIENGGNEFRSPGDGKIGVHYLVDGEQSLLDTLAIVERRSTDDVYSDIMKLCNPSSEFDLDAIFDDCAECVCFGMGEK